MSRIRAFLKKIRRSPESPIAEDAPRNEYYESISARLGVAQVVLYLALLAFVVISFLFNTELITYRNFYLFFRDLNASAETVDIFDVDSLTYPVSDEQSFTLYRKGLAVVGNTSITVFSATGRQIVSESVNYRDPVAVGSGKYLLVYEMGGTSYSLYNSYTQIHSGSTDYPISGAAVSESGMYALISASKQSTSTVFLYNDRFNLLGRYHKSGYVIDVAIDDDGKHMAILTSTPEAGLFSTELMLIKPGKNEATASVTLGESVGIACTYTSSGRVAVLCGTGVRYVASDGEVITEYDFDGRVPSAYDICEDGVSVCLKKSEISQKNIVIVFDKSGKIVYNDNITEEIGQIARCGNAVFWLTKTGIGRVEVASGTVSFERFDTTDRVLLAVSEEEAMCCSAQKAVYVSFRN